MKKLLLITISAFCSLASIAQDVHFTMYDAIETNLNPTTAGVFDGSLRAGLNYRNQWGSIGNAFKTYSVSIDGGLFKNSWKRGYIGVGLNAFKDVAGASSFGSTKINLSLSSTIYLDNRNTASLGFSTAWVQNSIDQSNLQWSSQFNGQAYDKTLSSNESFLFENKSYFDFTVGGIWNYGKGNKTLSSKDEFKIQAGLVFYHVARPSQQIEFGEIDKLYSKFAFHAQALLGLENSKIAFQPKVLVMFQGPARQYLVGTLVRYTLQEKSKYTGSLKGMSIAFGGYFRIGDAFAPSLEFEVSNFTIGVAYDMNVSGLSAATNGNGGMEIYLKFINIGSSKNSSARFR